MGCGVGDLITALDGTEAGRELAMVLALISAVAHAVFGALQKWRFDPWLTRGAIDVFYFAIALPFALFVFPLPTREVWALLAGVFVIHFAYKFILAMAYERAAYTVVYPVVRGTGSIGHGASARGWCSARPSPGCSGEGFCYCRGGSSAWRFTT